MKLSTLVLVLSVIVLFIKCSANRVATNSMSEDICEIMKKYDADDPLSQLGIVSDLYELYSKEKYKEVTEKQVLKRIKVNCPASYKNTVEMLSSLDINIQDKEKSTLKMDPQDSISNSMAIDIYNLVRRFDMDNPLGSDVYYLSDVRT